MKKRWIASLLVLTMVLLFAGCGSAGVIAPFKWGMSESEFNEAKTDPATFMGTEFELCTGTYGSDGLDGVGYSQSFSDKDEAMEVYSALNDKLAKKYDRKDEPYIYGDKNITIKCYVEEGKIGDYAGSVSGVPKDFLDITTYNLMVTVEHLEG